MPPAASNQTPPPAVPAATPVTPQPAPTATKSKVPKWLVIVIVLVAVVAGFIASVTMFVGNATKEAEAVSNKLINAVQADDPDAVYALTTKEFREATSEAEVDQLVGQLAGPLEGEEKIVGRTVETKGGVTRAAIVYSITHDGKTSYVRVVLQESGDKWEVLNFRASNEQLEAVIE